MSLQTHIVGKKGSDLKGLYLKVFSGEVLTAFTREAFILNTTTVKELTEGVSHRFPVLGNSFEVGTYADLTGTVDTESNPTNNEVEISIADPKYVQIKVNNFDTQFAHFEFRSNYNVQMANKLNKNMETDLVNLMLAAPVTVGVGYQNSDNTKNIIYNPDIATAVGNVKKGDAIYETLTVATTMYEEEDNTDEKFLIMRPTWFNILKQATRLLNKEFVSNSAGGLDTGEMKAVDGFYPRMCNNIPATYTWTGVSGVTGAKKVVAIVYTKKSVGTCRKASLTTGSEPVQNTLGKAERVWTYYQMGHGILDPMTVKVIVTD